MNNKDTGFLGENITAQYLTQNGFEILHRNWRYKHLEIDIIAFKDGILHIVEVKTRTDNQFGFPEQAITAKKMQFLKNAAAHYQTYIDVVHAKGEAELAKDNVKSGVLGAYSYIGSHYAITDKVKARENFEKALVLDPTSKYIKESLDVLKK